MASRGDGPAQRECVYKLVACLIGIDENGRFMRCDDPLEVSAFGVQDSGHQGSLHRGDKEALGTFMRCWPLIMKNNDIPMQDWKLHSMNGPAIDSLIDDGKLFSFAFEKCRWKAKDNGSPKAPELEKKG